MFGREKDEKKKEADVIGLIGKGMLVEGKISFEHTVRIDGDFKGEIHASGTLIAGDSAHIEGELRVGTAVITGEVVGLIEAKTRVELQSPAKVMGEIRTPNLIIGDGAVFDGKCVMLKSGSNTVVETTAFNEKKEGLQQTANF